MRDIVAAAAVDQNPPLYNVGMRAWVALAGDSEAALRWPSIVASAATASALFLLARRFAGIEAALYASLLFAASEPELYYAREARSYAVVGLLCTVSYFLFLANLARPAWRTALALGGVNAAAAWTHFTAILALVAQLATAVVHARARPRAVALYAAGQVLALALFAPWIGPLLANLPRAGAFWLAPPTLADAREVVGELAGGEGALVAQIAVLAVAGAALLLAARGARASSPPPSAVAAGDAPGTARVAVVAFAAWAVVPIALAYALSQRTPAFGTRYLLFSSLGWFLLVAAALARLPIHGALRAAAALAIAILAASQLDWHRTRNADWRAAVAFAEPGPGTAIVVAPAWQCLPFAYYLDRASFPDEARRARALAEARVACATSPRDVAVADLARATRVVVAFGKGVSPDFRSLFAALERAGFARAPARPFPGGNVVELRRSGAP